MAHMTTLRTLLVVASVHRSVSQVGVKNAFLSVGLHEEVYMWPHVGYSLSDDMVCRLRCSLMALSKPLAPGLSVSSL